MMSASVECSICHQPLPLGEPVAFMDKQKVIHVRCFPTAPGPRPSRPRRPHRTSPPARGREGLSL
jgi:hypothetical protein